MARPDDAGSELEALAAAITDAYLALRDFGAATGVSHPYGINVSTVLSILLDRGKLTVAEVARIRGVSRQYAIKLARQLEADGTVVVTANEPGSRSFTLQLTPKGVDQVKSRARRVRRSLADRVGELDVQRVNTARETVEDFRNRLAQR